MIGRLVYVCGASGSGKDTLIGYARARLGGQPGVVFTHRYITRPASAGGENHVALTPEEFAARRQAGLFALHWESHGLAYGVGIEIDQWLTKGQHVVVNGSRAYLAEAQRRYPDLLPVSIEVSPEVLRQRLIARGREDPQAIEARLARHHTLQASWTQAVVVRNDGGVDEGGEQLVRAILDHCPLPEREPLACA
jgi:ribose 1,5-bisphosphokinase